MRKLVVLMWKHLMVRKRRYIQTPIELISPIAFIMILFIFKDKFLPELKSGLRFDNAIRMTDELKLSDLPSPSRVLYTPDTEFTNNLMDEVGLVLGLKRFDKQPDRAIHQKGIYPISNISRISNIIATLNNDEAIVDLTERDEREDKLSYTILMKSNYYSTSYEPLDGMLKPHRQFGADYNIFMHLQWAMDTGFVKLFTGSNVTEKLSLQEFPSYARDNAELVPLICEFLITVCWLSLNLVFIFLMSRMLEERASGIQEMIKMVGVSPNLLGISHFLNVLPAGLVYSIGGTLLLKTTSKPLIPHSDGFIIMIMLFLHYVSIVAFAFPCSYITEGTQYSTTLAVFVYIVSWLPAAHLPKYMRSSTAIQACGIFPHMPMVWLWHEISQKELWSQGLGFSDIMKSHHQQAGPVALGALFLIIQTLLYFAVAWYLARVRPGMYGQAMPWNFLCQPSYWSKNEVKPSAADDEELPISREAKYFEQPPKNMETGIKIENVTKIFPKQKALSNVSLEVYKGEITVLLGHNGAGKTTLMSIITGMTSASEGRILVNGMDVSRASDQVRQELGLCPQHNLFFADLTVIEHAIFFTLLKGYSYKEARQKSFELLKRLGIQDKANVHSSALSGGMKRRLQLACALAGGASVLVLDEPTSGLDVETRRELWDLLLSLRGERTVLLTTHFMEEADALGDRVAALHQGHLRCHATPMYLKRAIGTGYRLTFTTSSSPREEAVTAAVTSFVPEATLKEKTINSLSYNLPATASAKFPELFSSIENERSELRIETIGVGVTTLEEVFLKLCSDTDTTFAEDEVDTATSTHAIDTTIKVTGVKLYCRQFAVLMKRLAKYTWDKKQSFIFLQVLIPIVLIVSFTRNTNNDVDEKKNATKLSLDLDVYEPMITRRVLYDVTDDAVNLRALRDSWPKVDFVDTRNVTQAILRASKDDVTEYNKYLVGIELNDTHAKALFTTTVRHAAPIALNLLTNALASRYIAQADGSTFHTSFHPLREEGVIELTDPLQEPKAWEKILVYGYFMLFVILSTNINNVSLPCNERVSGARHIHMMSGCPAVVHWAATCTYHMLLCAVFLILTLAISAAVLDRDHTIDSADVIMTMVLVLFLGSLAFFSVMYLVSWYLEERAAGIVLVAVLIIFTLVTSSIEISSIVLSADSTTTIWTALATLSGYVMPPHTTTMAFLKTLYSARMNAVCELNRDRCPLLLVHMPGFDIEKCCNNEKPMCYMCISRYAPGEQLIVLAAQFLFYMTLVILAQKGVFNSFGDKIFNVKYRNQAPKREPVDEIVQAESIYVEKQIALPKKHIAESEHALLVSNLHKNYFNVFSKSCNAVKGISFSVKQGECFGLLGVNGAGKSTTFKMLTAEECPTRGDIYANGYFRQEKEPYLRSLGYCPQFFGLDDFQTGRENLTLVLTLRGLDAKDVEREVKSWIEVVGLEKYTNICVREYSGGCKRRLAAAAALSSAAPLTLLDEPTAGVDVSARRRVWSALQRGQRQGRAVIITSHSMDEMEALCSRIAIMSGGVVRALGTPSELRANHATGHAVLIKMTQARVGGSDDEVDSAKSDVQRLKTDLNTKFNCTLKDEHKTMLHYHINESMRYSELFSALEQLKEQYRALVEDYCVTETTLEEVFLHIAKEQHERDEQERQAQQARRSRGRGAGQENNVV